MLYRDPTAVDLASFNAEPQGRNVVVWWETAIEMDNLGFNLDRSKVGGERTRLNDWLIPGQRQGRRASSCRSCGRFTANLTRCSEQVAWQVWHLRRQVPEAGVVLLPDKVWQDFAGIGPIALTNWR